MRPTSAKRKGKQFEDKVAQQLHNIFLQIVPEYRKQVATTYRIGNTAQVQVRRNLTSGTISYELGDIYLPETIVNWFIEQFNSLPVVECKKQKVFDLRKPKQLLQQIIKANEQIIKQVDNKIKVPIPNVNYTIHLIVFSGHYERSIWSTICFYDYLSTKQSRWLITQDSTKLPDISVTLHDYTVNVSLSLVPLSSLKEVLKNMNT